MGRARRQVSRRRLEMNISPQRDVSTGSTIPGEPERKQRPALVVSVNARNRLADDVLVVPASTTLRPADARPGEKGNRRPAARFFLKCEQITTLSKRLLSPSALGGPLSEAVLEDVERGVLRALGVPIP